MQPSHERPPRSILIVRLGAIGDVVHGLPLLCRLRSAFPDTHIAWAVGERAAPLLLDHPALDERIVIEKRRPLRFVTGALRLRARGFDVAMDLQGLLASGLVVGISGARERWGFDGSRVREGAASLAHTRRLRRRCDAGAVVAQNLEFADALGAPRTPLEWGLEPREDEVAAARAMLPATPFAAFVVGAGKPANRPFPGTLAAAARRLEESGLAAVAIGGEKDRDEGALVAGETGTNLCGRTDLRGTVAALSLASVAIGGDTGPLQVAAALRTPCVALFGGANPGRTGPEGAPVRVIWKRWRCAPCYRRSCPIGRECLAAITAGEIVEAAHDVARSERGQVQDLAPAAGLG